MARKHYKKFRSVKKPRQKNQSRWPLRPAPVAQPMDHQTAAAGGEVEERMDKLLHLESQREHRLRMGF